MSPITATLAMESESLAYKKPLANQEPSVNQEPSANKEPTANKESLVDIDAVADIPNFECIIEPGQIVDVGSPVSGIVDQVYVDIGDTVEQGMALSSLDSKVVQATLALASIKAKFEGKVELHKENAAFSLRSQQRNQKLFNKNAISLQEIDQLETELRLAQLQVGQATNAHQIAKLDYRRVSELLKQLTIRSPIKGVVMERFISGGEYVKDKPLMRIAQLDPLNVEIILPVEYMGRIPIGLHAEVTPTVSGYGKQLATVERIDRVADTASGTFGIRLRLPNPDYLIPGGLRCDLSFLPEISPKEPEIAENNSASSSSKSVSSKNLAVVESLINNSAGNRCYKVGPVQRRSLAKKLSKGLAEHASKLEIRKEKTSKIRDYIVLSKPQHNRSAVKALIARLKTAGVRDYFEMPFSAKNGYVVSVGLYNKRFVADRRVRKLAKKGFTVDAFPRKKSSNAYWLDISIAGGKEAVAKVNGVVKAISVNAAMTSTSCNQQLALQ
ncbi:MAG: hypothetical protein COA99_10430 [Moraxellaceae bacterium]|nr:MAG: hypothetical protein COA99_10430 [Moraxellaceae bacterium]